MKNFFISSTFTDMHHERDYLRLEVFPELSKRAFQYGDDIGMRDLRWGIPTSDLTKEEADEHVLSACLEEIDMCRPYMIVLIGNRYGSKFHKKQLEDVIRKLYSASTVKNTIPPLPDGIEELSITEMEIRYGAMWHPEGTPKPKVIFYIRELEGDSILPEYTETEDDKKNSLKNLKTLIRSLKHDKENQGNIIILEGKATEDKKCSSPCYKKDFCNQMTEAILQILQEEWKYTQSLTDYQKELKQHRAYALANTEKFFVRSNILNTIYKRLSDYKTDFIAIQGEPGSGKTSIMSYLASHPVDTSRNIQDTHNIAILPLFCSYTLMTCQATGLMRHMIAFIEEQYEKPLFETEESENSITGNDFEESGFEELRIRLEKSIRTFDQYAKISGKRIFILIDSIDQLDASKIRDNLLFLPRNPPSTIRIIISCADRFNLSFWKDHVINMNNLEDDGEIDGILCKTLSSYGKELEKPLIDTIKKKPHSHNPLYLSLLIQRLNMMVKKDFDTIKRMNDNDHYSDASALYKNQLIEACPDELNAMCRHILNTASEQTGGKTAQLIVQYISASRYGLRQSDLEHIFGSHSEKWNALSFAKFYQYMRSLFIIREDGRYDFSHLSIRDGFREMLEDSPDTADVYLHKKILEHLKSNTLPASDPLKMNESVYHCWKSDDKNYLIKYLCSISSIPDKTDESLRVKIIKAAARSIYEICTAFPKTNSEKIDGTQNNDSIPNGTLWFCEVLENCDAWKHPDGTAAILHFIHNYLGKAFEESFRELDLQKTIYTKCLKLAEALHQAIDNEKSLYILADACYQLGNICHRQGGSLNYSQALGLYLREARITESLQKHPGQNMSLDYPLPERHSLIRNCENLSRLGDIYSDMGGHENQNRALRSYLKSRELLDNLMNQPDYKKTDSIHFLYQKTCQRIGSLQSSYGWESCRNAFNNYMNAQKIISRDPISYKHEQISLNLRIGDLFLHAHYRNHTAQDFIHDYQTAEELASERNVTLHDFMYYYQAAEKFARDMKGQPPKSENELTWLICRERIDYAEALMGKNTTWENINVKYQLIFNGLDKLTPDNMKNIKSEKDAAYISLLNLIRAVYCEHASSLILRLNASGQELIIADQLLQKAEELLEDLCSLGIRNDCRRNLLVVYCKRADILTELRNRHLSAPDTKLTENLYLSDIKAREALAYYNAALKEANQLLNETRTPLSRHDYLVILTRIGDLYYLNEESGFSRKAEEYYMLGLEEAIALDKEMKSPISMMDISLLCGRISRVCKDKAAAEDMMKRSRMLRGQIQQLYKIHTLQDLKDCCLNLYCSQIHLPDGR